MRVPIHRQKSRLAHDDGGPTARSTSREEPGLDPAQAPPTSEQGAAGHDFGSVSVVADAEATPQTDTAESSVERMLPRHGVPRDVAQTIDETRGMGEPLGPETRERFERALNYSFSNIRIHADQGAGYLARTVGARAFTTGRDLYFDHAEYQPGSVRGDRLIAHELTHVVQQRTAAGDGPLAVSQPGEAAEVEADRVADAVVDSGFSGAAPSPQEAAVAHIHRQTPGEAGGDKSTKPGASPSHAASTLTAQEKQKVDNAAKLIEKAAKNRSSAADALKKYASVAPGKMTALKTSFDSVVKLYAQAAEKVNYKIQTAKDIAAVRNEVLSTVVSAAFGGVTKLIDDKVISMVAKEEEMQKAYGSITAHFADIGGQITAPFAKPLGDVKSDAAGAAGMGGMSTVSGPAPGGPPWASELSFYKSYSELHGKGAKLLPLANAIGEISGPIGKIEQAIADIRAAGKALTYPIEKLDKDAAVLADGTTKIAAAAPGVGKLADELSSLVSQAEASAPRNVDEVEDELWIRWAADLGPKATDALDEDYLEDYLRKRGIWKRLGIEIGHWFSDEEEAMAVVSANAQAKVMDHRGETFELRVAEGRALADAKLGDLPALPVIMATGGVDKGLDAQVKAVVVGAQANRKMDVYGKTQNTKTSLTNYALEQRYISVIARSFEVIQFANEIKLPDEEAKPK